MKAILEHNKLRIGLKILVIILLIGVCSGGAYVMGLNNQTKRTTQQNADSEKDIKPVVQPKQDPIFHTVMSTRYPFRSDFSMTTKLAVPDNLQAVLMDTSIADQGYTTLLGDKFNIDMGRWAFGRPNMSDYDGAGQFSIIQIEDSWLNASGDPNSDSRKDTELGISLSATSPQRKTFIENLKNETNGCVKDTNKGFVLGTYINMCYKIAHSPASSESYNPTLHLKGYGEVKERKFVAVGYLFLNEDDSYTGAQKDQFTKEFQEGKTPAHTLKTLNHYVSALKNTTITIKVSSN